MKNKREIKLFIKDENILVDWIEYGIHRLYHCRGERLPPNDCPGYDIKQTDGVAAVMLGLWEMQSTLSLP